MSKIHITSLVLIFSLAICHGQRIGNQLIGSAGANSQGKSGIIMTYSLGESIVDYYKCHNNKYRIGFIQSVPFQKESVKVNGLNLSPDKSIQVTDRSSTNHLQINEKYILFDAVGRILQKGVNFRKEDRAFNFHSSGIYFLQTSIDNRNVRTEKIMFSR